MSGELIVNDAGGTKPRVGGFEFEYDAAKGLWRTPEALQAGHYYIDLPSMLSVSWPQYRIVSGGDPEPAKPPASASPLWDNPETVTTEIVAYRAWHYVTRIDDDGVTVRLKSLHNDFLWEGPVTTADVAPDAENANGLYAIRGDAHHKDNFVKYIDDEDVWGRVALSGIVVEGECGYRAERMTIQELWVNPVLDGGDSDDSPEGLCKMLGDRYQCDVTMRKPRWSSLAVKEDA